MTVRTGRCNCGAVRFEAGGPLREVVYCHCSQCRRQSGHYFAATLSADEDLVITGEDNLTWYRASDEAGRGFCKTCGSTLFWKRDGSDRTSILAGAFDAPSGLTEARHIFTADKGEYYEITDGLPAFEQYD